MSNKPLITVITATYNSGKTLEQTIISVINQEFDDFEYIIVDGCSEDETIKILERYKDSISKIITEKDDGIYDALNKGLAIAEGEWVYILGSDDVLMPSALNEISKYLSSFNTAYYGNVLMKSTRKIFNNKFSLHDLMYKNISHQSIFYPKIYYKKNKYDTKYKIAADYVYLMNFIKNKNFKLEYQNIIVAEYNDTDGVSSKNEDSKFIKDRIKIIKETFPLVHYILYMLRYYLVKLLKIFGVKEFLKMALKRWMA